MFWPDEIWLLFFSYTKMGQFQIFRLSFGAGVILIIINIIHLLVISVLLRNAVPAALYVLTDRIFTTLFYLLYLSACLAAGILMARKMGRAGSATLASLLIALLFLLGDFISCSIMGFGFSLSFPLLIAPPGIYAGFLGGLIGRTTERTRKAIGIFYAIGVVFASVAALSLLFKGNFLDSPILEVQGTDALLFVSIVMIGSLSGMAAWILTLAQFAQAQSWSNFTLTFFFSGIMVLISLIVGVQPSQPVQYVALSPGAYPPPVAGIYPPMQPAPAPPPQADTLTILQQRFARGEIDAESYRQMLVTLTMLTGPSTNSPLQS